MDRTCDSCETNIFCMDMQRCFNTMLAPKYEETDVTDLDELTADKVHLKKIIKNEDVFSKPLSSDIFDIIKSAIN